MTNKWRQGLRILSVPVLALALYAAFGLFDLGGAAQEAWMDSHVRGQGLRGIALYIGLVTVLTAVGVPRQVCSFLGGYVFDVFFGTLWATVGTGLACVLTFSYARFLGQDVLYRKWGHRKWGHKLRSFDAFLGQSPFLLTTAVRIVPLGSNFVTNIVAGLSRIPAFPFLAGSVLGFTVQNAIFALMGSGLRFSTGGHALLSALLYVLSLALGYGVYRHYKKTQG